MTSFYDLKFMDEDRRVNELITAYQSHPLDHHKISQHAEVLIRAIRQKKSDASGFQSIMQGYDLSSDEGVALMTLAEALLRIPDAHTANALITDKLSDGDWNNLFSHARDITGRFSGFGLNISQKILDSAISKIGMPFIRKACVEAMQMMGKTFVLGRDIDEALKTAKSDIAKGYIHSYDMLGEGARTSKDAEKYFDAYINAIRAIGQATKDSQKDLMLRPGISIKLSALHPRYEFAQSEACIPALTDKLTELCIVAAEYRLNLTVDAEECDRLGTSLRIIKNVLDSHGLQNWHGFGLAVQAYHKRAEAVIDRVIEWAKDYERKIAIRLVKGAYWDTEIKHAQVEGLPDYPVFTRKENTDLSYLVCAKKLLDHRDVLMPMFGTHNAHTIATIIEMAGNDRSGFLFQRLHGMGESLHDQILLMDIPSSIYAPVGTHKDLLAYLVRRLLENGANSSFVNKIYDDAEPIEDLVRSPIDDIERHGDTHRHPKIPLPSAIYSDRQNSDGIDLHADKPLAPLFASIHKNADKKYNAPCLINAQPSTDGTRYTIQNPSNHHDSIGDVYYAKDRTINDAFDLLSTGFESWNNTSVDMRATCLEKLADLYHTHQNEIMALLIREAGKTIPDAIGEVREAIDFCRYYAMEARKHFKTTELEGPTGELNTLTLEGRGIFVCISPWNFPFAIFTGQIVAALVAGNCVISKPAEQTPAIATYAVNLMLKAGVPASVIALLHGDGEVGAKIIAHENVGGVAFTGSTQVAKMIQRALAEKDGPIIPLIAETGGLNAMIVDSSALPEQVTDDAIHSAFGSAGQRCSALRILCVQDDVADDVIAMIQGRMDHIVVGDPVHLSTDVGPIIDQEAMANLVDYRVQLEGTAKDLYTAPYDDRLDKYGTFFTPVMAEMDDIDMINHEAFGPILHVVRYDEKALSDLIKKINAKGFGLTFGLHTRIHDWQEDIAKKIKAGNIYINRGQTGAVVGVQPFGGRGLSGTGPKAGGPYYLHAFATEKSVSNDITASGGNVKLVNL
jgi:RHH-type proline utilization regulon transcriptional repressor/proline dehydrogenase/delta 1-pyrroline-5-carboxylate dehydrogenase